MPQVPYSPVPDVAPRDIPTPSLRVDAPIAAFGGTVAAAVGSVGGDLEKDGNEIFQRAMALQDLNNHAASDKANMDFVEALGQRHAQFTALRGIDAQNAYPQYIQDVHNLRQQFGANLNPMARRYYDQESRNQAARTIFNGAGHAGDQFREYLKGNAGALIDLDAKNVFDNPNDEILYNQKIEQARGHADNLAQLEGFGPDSPYAQDKAKQAISKITLNRILSAAREQPTVAMDMYQRLKGNMVGSDVLHAEAAVMGQNRSVGAANIAQEVFSTGWDDQKQPVKSLTQMEQEVRDKAAEFSPTDPILANNAVRTLKTLYTQRMQTEKVDDWMLGQTVRDIIQAHPDITTEQQLRAIPEARQALDSLSFKGRGIDAPGYIHRYIESKFREVSEEHFYQLRSLAAHDREGFLGIDFTDPQWRLNVRQIDQLNQIRARLIRHPDDDPKLRQWLDWMRGARNTELTALGVYTRDKNNPDDYDKYAGMLLQAGEAWTAVNKRPPDYKAITEEIGPQVIKQSVDHHMLWWDTTGEPAYRTIAPTLDFIAQAKRRDPNLSDSDIRRGYAAKVFQTLFSKPPSPTTPPSK